MVLMGSPPIYSECEGLVEKRDRIVMRGVADNPQGAERIVHPLDEDDFAHEISRI
jgi:hypothetical protein